MPRDSDEPERVLPVEVWTNGRHGTMFAAAYSDQINFVLPNNTVVEIDLEVFRGLMLRLLIAAYSAPR